MSSRPRNARRQQTKSALSEQAVTGRREPDVDGAGGVRETPSVSEHELISDVAGVERVARIVAASPQVTLSGETNALHAYRERLCLLVVGTAEGIFAIDLTALRGRPRPLRALEAPLTQARPALWVHGAEYLVAALKRDFLIALDGIVDAQQAAVLLGRPRTGYRSLVADLVGAPLEAPISVDWAARPLSEEALLHAVEKVRYLPAVVTALEAEIRAADLEDELRVAGREVGWTPPEIGRFDPAGFLKLKGASRLPAAGRRVLRALWSWRDTKARTLDVPPGRLMPNERLVELAKHPEELGMRLRGERFHSRLVWGDVDELIDAVVRALTDRAPLPERRETAPPAPGTRERGQRLKAWRAEEAARRGVGLQAILPAKSLRYLELHGLPADADLETVPGLGGRRRERYGERLRELCSR
ncbi:MAG: hypothetical protein EP329_05995 [Deltaproteobacteria bacterium]|nr:MAG: hypothetical protein EP329_05995 [Deltaproteobacteria bacterium]